MAAALAKAFRGGRSAFSSHLLFPVMFRREAQECVLPHLSPAAPAAAMDRLEGVLPHLGLSSAALALGAGRVHLLRTGQWRNSVAVSTKLTRRYMSGSPASGPRNLPWNALKIAPRFMKAPGSYEGHIYGFSMIALSDRIAKLARKKAAYQETLIPAIICVIIVCVCGGATYSFRHEEQRWHNSVVALKTSVRELKASVDNMGMELDDMAEQLTYLEAKNNGKQM